MEPPCLTSILSRTPDHYGYHYGFSPDDPRQVNVRLEPQNNPSALWHAYVGGERVPGAYGTKAEAETAALTWIKNNPLPGNEC